MRGIIAIGMACALFLATEGRSESSPRSDDVMNDHATTDASFWIRMEGDRLSVRLRDVPVRAVLQELQRVAIVLRIATSVMPEDTLTMEFDGATITDGMQKLFPDSDIVLLLRSEAGPGVTNVTIFPRGSALGRVGTIVAGAAGRLPVTTLEQDSSDGDRSATVSAIEDLVNRGDPEALRHLHAAIRDPDRTVRRLVLESVIQLDEAVWLVQEAADDTDDEIRAIAISSLESRTDRH